MSIVQKKNSSNLPIIINPSIGKKLDNLNVNNMLSSLVLPINKLNNRENTLKTINMYLTNSNNTLGFTPDIQPYLDILGEYKDPKQHHNTSLIEKLSKRFENDTLLFYKIANGLENTVDKKLLEENKTRYNLIGNNNSIENISSENVKRLLVMSGGLKIKKFVTKRKNKNKITKKNNKRNKRNKKKTKYVRNRKSKRYNVKGGNIFANMKASVVNLLHKSWITGFFVFVNTIILIFIYYLPFILFITINCIMRVDGNDPTSAIRNPQQGVLARNLPGIYGQDIIQPYQGLDFSGFVDSETTSTTYYQEDNPMDGAYYDVETTYGTGSFMNGIYLLDKSIKPYNDNKNLGGSGCNGIYILLIVNENSKNYSISM